MSLLSSGITVKISEIKSMSWDISEVTVAPRPYHALVFRKKGGADFLCGQKQIHTGSKEIFYMPANLEYHAIYKEANSIAVIHFDSDYKGDAENFKTTAPEILETLFDRVIDIWNKKELGYYYSALAVTYEILSNLQKSNSDSVNTTLHSDFLSAVKYADTHFTDPSLSVDMLAKKAHISGTYFRKLFLKHYGKSPCEYLVSLRLNHAKNMLASGKHTVYETALASGFSDPKYFSRVVKKIYGIPPSRLYKHTGG